jgi:hypothetical protein
MTFAHTKRGILPKETKRILLVEYNKYRKNRGIKKVSIQRLKQLNPTKDEERIIKFLIRKLNRQNPEILTKVEERINKRKQQLKVAQKSYKKRKEQYNFHKILEEIKEEEPSEEIIDDWTTDYNYLVTYKIQLKDDNGKLEWKTFKNNVVKTTTEIKSLHDIRLNDQCNIILEEFISNDDYHQFENLRNSLTGYIDNFDFEKESKNLNDNIGKIEVESIKEISDQDIQLMKMCSDKHINYFVFNDQTKALELNNTTENKNCVVHYLADKMNDRPKFKKNTYNSILQQFLSIGINPNNGINLVEFDQYITTFHNNNISYHAYDVLLNPIKQKIAIKQANLSLYFVICNQHLYPIENDEIQNLINKTSSKINLWKIRFNKNFDKTEEIKHIYVEKTDSDMIEQIINGTISENYKLIITNTTLLQICDKIIKKFNIVPLMNINNMIVQSFKHPISLQIVEFNDNYEMNKDYCNKLNELYPSINFRNYTNQTIASLTSELFHIVSGEIPKYQQAKEDYDICEKYMTTPLIQTVIKDYELNLLPFDNIYSIDRKTAYPRSILKDNIDYPIFGLFDNFTNFNESDEIKMGEYLVKSFEIPKFGMKIQPQIWTYSCIVKLLKMGYITKKDIILKRYANKILESTILKDFVNYCFKNFDYNTAKHALRLWIGNEFGKRTTTNQRGCIISDENSLNSLYLTYHNYQYSTTMIDDLYFFRIQERIPIYANNSSIYRQVIGLSEIHLLEMIEKFSTKDNKFISCNVDCCNFYDKFKTEKDYNNKKITNDIINKKHSEYKIEEYKPRKYNLDKKDYTISKLNIVENKEWKLSKDYINQSFLYTGCPGCGKSTTLSNNVDESTVVLTFTNKSADNIRKMINNKKVECRTFDSYFMFRKNFNKKIKKCCIDEYSMVPMKFIELLYSIKLQNPNIIFQFYGDKNQCSPVESIYCEYTNKNIFKYLCDYNLIEKSYNSSTGRYTNEVKHILEYLLKNKRLPKILNQQKYHVDDSIKFNICKTNKTVNEINEIYSKSEPITRMISNKNFYKYNVFKSAIYNIGKIYGKTMTLLDDKNNIIVDENNKEVKFKIEHFNYIFAITTHKTQSITLDEPINILETKRLKLDEIYTAMSRIRNLNQLHIEYTNREFKKKMETTNNIITPVQLQPTYIYLLTNEENNKFYVGQTSQNPEDRLNQHLEIPKNGERQTNVHKYNGEWNQEILDTIYNNLNVVLKIETKYIQKYQILYGENLINKRQLINMREKRPIICMGNPHNIEDKFDLKPNGLMKYITERKNNSFRFKITRNKVTHYKDIKFWGDKDRARNEIMDYAKQYINNNI